MGTNTLSWRIVSVDGHPVAGSLIFSIGQVTGAGAEPPAGDKVVAVAIWATKALLFIALFIGIGGATFGAFVPLPGEARRTSMAFSLVGLLVAPLTLGLQGLDVLGLPLPALFLIETWRDGLATSYAATIFCITAAFVLAIVGLSFRSRLFGFSAWLVGALSLVLSGHASTATPQWLTRPAVFVHIAGVLFWIGALLPLWHLLRERSNNADQALVTFSRLIPWAVGPLVLAGIVLATVQMGPPDPSWITAYTAILSAKLVLVLLFFAFAIWNRLWLTTPASIGDAGARRRLRRSISLEVLFVMLVAGLVAGWRFTPPPRAIAAAEVAAAEPVFVHLMDDGTMAMLEITPGRAGPVAIDLDVTTTDGAPLAVDGIVVAMSEPDLGIEPLRRQAIAIDGRWRVDDLIIPAPGIWHVEVEIRLSRFSMTRLQETVEILP